MPVRATFTPSPPKKTARSPIKVGEFLNPDPAEKLPHKDTVSGILPGYAGYRPGARDEYGGSAYGGVPKFGVTIQGKQTYMDKLSDTTKSGLRVFSTESTQWGNQDAYPAKLRQYKEEVHGILPGYAGHIPAARDEVGMSAWGNVPLKGAKAQSLVGHPNLGGGIIGGKVRFEGKSSGLTDDRTEYKTIVGGVLPGYSGFVPAARDKFGATTNGGGKLTKVEL